MKLIDTYALIVLIFGLINPDIFNKHERTSIEKSIKIPI